MELLTTEETALSCYRLEKIPTDLYNNWREIVWNMSDIGMMRQAVSRMLKAWLWVRFPMDKLCAFDDLTEEEAGRLGLSPGMYVILRRMTTAELILNQRARAGEIPPEEDPQWILEANNLEPYVNDCNQINSIDYPQRSRQPLLQGEL